MYIESFKIENIKAIEKFEMVFQNPAGWHVLIGNNSSGKSTILRAIASALVGPNEIDGITPNWNLWLRNRTKEGSINLTIQKHEKIDKQSGVSGIAHSIEYGLKWKKTNGNGVEMVAIGTKSAANKSVWGGTNGWFSTGFGAFRRFTGGSEKTNSVLSNPSFKRLAAHLSLFADDVDLSKSIEWLKDLNYKKLEKSKKDKDLLDKIFDFINNGDLLPTGVKLERISSEGVFFKDSSANEILITQLSDGYRSVLSLVFEMIRQMVQTYSVEPFEKDSKTVDITGVVLMDEIDAHLHPTWQTEIGKWFTKYFPKIQFIVTSHSPLVCRACENGSIWRLATPTSGQESGEVIGVERESLIYGNILDAYGTELFGQSPVRSQKSNEKLERLGQLNLMATFGKITKEEENERQNLQQILSTDAPTGF